MLKQSRFFEITKFIIFLLVSFSLSGCIEIKTQINLNENGSGTIEENFVPKGMMAQFAVLSNASKAQQKNLSNEEKIKQQEEKAKARLKKLQKQANKYGEGVKVLSEQEDKNTLESKVVYSFKDINKVKLSPFSKTDNAEETPISFQFSKGQTNKLIITMPPKSVKDDQAESKIKDETKPKEDNLSKAQSQEITAEQLQIFKGLFDGMKAYCSVRINGKVKTSNASYLNEENSEIVLFDVDFSKITNNPEFLKLIQEMKTNESNKVFFDFNPELADKFKEVKIEQKEKVSVEF